MSGWLITALSLFYLSMLFAIASIGDRHGARLGLERSRPLIYALSIAIYCTSWTFFGSVGLASARGFEFLAIYIGPALVFLFASGFIKRIARLSKVERITSIADFLAARYGKRFSVALVATIIATIGTIPYIALQLKAISDSLTIMSSQYAGHIPPDGSFFGDIALVIAALLALFGILFGTRHSDATEHQNGLVLAVSVETIVKLVSFLILGITVTLFLFGNPSTLLDAISANPNVQQALDYQTSAATWVVQIILSALAILLLPRQFYVTIVENHSDKEIDRARWLFPLYLIAINLFVLPIAFAGLTTVGNEVSADLYVLAIPLKQGQHFIALIALIGGLSAATAMVIVASVALSIMISNDLVIPLILRRLMMPQSSETEDWSRTILHIRRAAIFIVLFLAFLYYRGIVGNVRLASIGLLSFAAIAQFAPAFLGGLFWRGANARGAILGMVVGFAVWFYTLLLPTIVPVDWGILKNGLFGLSFARPQALFGLEAEPLNHGVFWSLFANSLCFFIGSLSRKSTPRERIQAGIFVPQDSGSIPSFRRQRTSISVQVLQDTITRYLGAQRTTRSFQNFKQEQGKSYRPSDLADPELIRFSEQLLASAVGSSSARLILSLILQREAKQSEQAYRLLGDATDALQQNRDLLQIALDQMEQGITVFDADFGLKCWNRKFRTLFDLPPSFGQVGTPLSKVIDYLVTRGDITPEDEADVFAQMTQTSRPWKLELQSRQRIIELRCNPMPEGGIVATYTDISEQVRADLKLKRINETLEQRVNERTTELTNVNRELAQTQKIAEEANLSKTRFLAGAGHDILQPLNAARLYCAALMEKIHSKENLQATINIDSSLNSVETILSAVLDISRLDSGVMKPNETTFNLLSVLQRIENDFQPLAQEKKLELAIIGSSIHVHSDQNLFRRLVQNLVSNAIKYTRNGRVVVGVRRRGDLCELQVIDTGIGIHKHQLNKVFNEFTRLDEGVREAQGLGLGLSIVDRIAQVLGLEIRISSAPNEGTSFSVLLPIATAPTLVHDIPDQREPSKQMQLAHLNILCIDNDEGILDGMTMLLKGWGCVVFTASHSFDLHKLDISLKKIDVILADFHLDGETGFEAIGRARMQFGAHVPAVLVTADRSSEVKDIAQQLEIPIIHKPVKPAVLRSTLHRYHKLDIS